MTMAESLKKWEELASRYKNYLKLEKRLSDNTVEAYLHDLHELTAFIVAEYDTAPRWVTPPMIEAFMASLYDRQASKTSQARILSGVKSFFNYLLMEGAIESSPAEFIMGPKSGRKLPEVLSLEEIDRIIDSIDETTPHGIRNRAMLETLYSCGLRVSELVALRTGDLFFNDGFVRVIGKGDKERLIPISRTARQRIERYLPLRNPKKNCDTLFLNNRGQGMTRVMVFTIIREAALAAGITKEISPHTFRHSFATHLLEGGASIRQVQELLGHESILTTEIYTHLDSSHLRQTVERHHPLGLHPNEEPRK